MSKKISLEYVDNIYALLIAIMCNTNSDKAFELYYSLSPKLTETTYDDWLHMKKLHDRNVKVKDIAAIYGVSAPTIYSFINKVNNISTHNLHMTN